MIEYFKIAEGRIVEAGEADAQIYLISAPSPAQKTMLTETWGIDEHNVNSALDPDEISRVEIEETHSVLIVKRPKSYSADNQFQFKVTSIGLFLFSDKMIILSDSEAPWFWQDKRFMKISSLRTLMLSILGYCTDHFMGHLRVISQISDEVEQQINDSMENKYLIYMFTLNKGLVYYLKSISSNTLLIQKLSSQTRFGFTEEERELVEDLAIDNAQCYRIAEIYGNILSNMMDARASIVGNNLNIWMKRLSIITLGIMMPSLVVSIFSMNVALPFPGPDQCDAIWPFISVMGISAIVTFLLFYVVLYRHPRN